MTVFLVERSVDWNFPERIGIFTTKELAEKAIQEDIRYWNDEYDWGLTEEENYSIYEELVFGT